MKNKIIRLISIGVQLRILIRSFLNLINDGPLWYSVILWFGILLWIAGDILNWVRKNIELDKQLYGEEQQDKDDIR